MREEIKVVERGQITITHKKKFKLYFIVKLESLMDFKQRDDMHFKEED